MANAVTDDARMEELEYIQASNVNVSNFVTEKLSGPYNYHIWRAQILCLTESHHMRGIIENGYDRPQPKSVKIIGRYESLLKGWILGSINQEIHNHVLNCSDPMVLWQKIGALYLANQSRAICKSPLNTTYLISNCRN